MPQYRTSQAAVLLQVSDDTVRRWVEQERLQSSTDSQGRTVIEGVELAAFMRTEALDAAVLPMKSKVVGASARNRLPGLVTAVVRDTVMAQVEVQVGPHRMVSLMSREAADELELAPGVLVVASVKATHVVIDALDLA
ncbi:MAG: TOBE domain-containing protein [Candidatus Nanopelagicales bacterium]|jgi:molybdopterin-binding protein|nr:TOBE domain-containing protein [Candidatus Nanopelagicales bacterium]MDP4824435.1 TOBE domain-containing protein [Candidatus Nanopelagicales bacterium]MDP4888186.1 TOBE domain-containing protein [Candidatus Nanopelagicales bacterium]